MAISRTTRTHLIYQFIILTLLFLGIGYNELLPERKFVLFLAFIPMFCYQMLILACCMELLPVPSWISLGESASKKVETQAEETGKGESLLSSPESKPNSQPRTKNPAAAFADVSDKIHGPRRWEKSAVNIGPSHRLLAHPQRSKSWVNLSDSTKCVMEPSLSREGSLDVLAPMSKRKLSSHALNRANRHNYREERANKAKSWKPGVTDFDASDIKTEAIRLNEVPTQKRVEVKQPPRVSAVQEEDSELTKSYSFPFRQKRLETWLEMKETETRESNQSLDMPYWQTVGYNLAVKYEARRRRRAVSSPTKLNYAHEIPLQNTNLQISVEIPKDAHKPSQKKTAKSAANCINKIKTSFSNLISKKKDEITENTNVNPSRALKPSLSFKSRNKSVFYQAKNDEKVSLPELPQFLSTDRPLIFYPKYIPFEKERFETDVQKKIVELSDEQKNSLPRFQSK